MSPPASQVLWVWESRFSWQRLSLHVRKDSRWARRRGAQVNVGHWSADHCCAPGTFAGSAAMSASLMRPSFSGANLHLFVVVSVTDP